MSFCILLAVIPVEIAVTDTCVLWKCRQHGSSSARIFKQVDDRESAER